MSPSYPPDYFPYRCLRNLENGSDLRLRQFMTTIQSANLLYVTFSKLGSGTSRAFSHLIRMLFEPSPNVVATMAIIRIGIKSVAFLRDHVCHVVCVTTSEQVIRVTTRRIIASVARVSGSPHTCSEIERKAMRLDQSGFADLEFRVVLLWICFRVKFSPEIYPFPAITIRALAQRPVYVALKTNDVLFCENGRYRIWIRHVVKEFLSDVIRLERTFTRLFEPSCIIA